MKSRYSCVPESLLTVILSLGVMAIQPSEPAFAGPGCTGVPDYIFYDACNNHDECYDSARLSRHVCDNLFLDDMYRACDAENRETYCHAVANTYYAGVWILAHCHYGSNQTECDEPIPPIVRPSFEPFEPREITGDCTCDCRFDSHVSINHTQFQFSSSLECTEHNGGVCPDEDTLSAILENCSFRAGGL
jgi:Prokaryotic phospholipase A2